MIRYVKQRDKSSCGPLALLNALKWAGSPVTTKDLKMLRSLVSHTRKRGTSHIHFDNALDKCFFNYYLTPKMREIEQHIKRGYIVIALGIHPAGGGGHFFLITNVSKGGKIFEVVNMWSNIKVVTKIGRKRLKTYLTDKRSKVWHIF